MNLEVWGGLYEVYLFFIKNLSFGFFAQLFFFNRGMYNFTHKKTFDMKKKCM